MRGLTHIGDRIVSILSRRAEVEERLLTPNRYTGLKFLADLVGAIHARIAALATN